MKKIIFIFLLLFALSAQAQTSMSNFEIQDNSVVYRRIYESDMAKDEFLKQLLTTQGITEAEDKGELITAKIEGMSIEIKKHGGSWSSSPMVLQKPLYGNMIVEFKDGRYRITLSNLNFVETGGFTEEKYPVSFYAINKRKQWRKNRKFLEVLHYTNKHMEDVFSPKELAASEDW
jgi:hypothetical protein